MFINEKLFNLLTDFADCYDANLVPVVPTHPNLTYIAFKNAEARDAIIPFTKERFIKEHDDDLIFQKMFFDDDNSWESITFNKFALQQKIDRLSTIEDEVNKMGKRPYVNDNTCYEIYNKCCYCFDKNQQRIVLVETRDICKIEYFIFKSALYKVLFNDFLKYYKRALVETSINDMCFCWSKDYMEWESINHRLIQPTTLRKTQSFLEQYKTTHNELENI